MRLSPIDEIREVLGFDDMADIYFAIQGALNAATPVIAASLGQSNFDRAVSEDRFYVMRPSNPVGRSGSTEFLLRHGCVDSIESISVRGISGTGLGFVDADGDTRFVTYADDTVADIKDRFTLSDLSKGIIKDLDWPYLNNFVVVKYTHGFETDITDTTMYDQQEVPDWLKQASKLQGMLNLASSPAIQQTSIKLETAIMRTELAQLLAANRRYAPNALLPM